MLERLMPVVRAARGGAGSLAVVGLVSAAVIAWLLFGNGLPDETVGWVARGLLALLAFVPGAILAALWFALGELLEVPGRIRRVPETAREHAAELERGLRELDNPQTRARSRLGAIWRLTRIPRAARDAFAVYAPITALLSPPFLIACALSAAAVPGLAVIALVALLIELV